MPRLRLSNFIAKDEHSHYARNNLNNLNFTSAHRHDFFEIFWIEAGGGYHLIQGQRRILGVGDLRLICPDDEHDFCTRRGKSLRLVNFAFRVSTWTYLSRRYLQGREDPFRLPVRQREFHCSETQINRLAEWSLAAAARDRSRLTTERLLLNILGLLSESPSECLEVQPPEWLRRACDAIREPQQFLGGPNAFTHLSGRSAEHVARSTRQFFGKTPTQIVNEARLAFAERLLMESDNPITVVAQQCGFESMTYFYELFLQRTGFTPARFRRRSLNILGRSG